MNPATTTRRGDATPDVCASTRRTRKVRLLFLSNVYPSPLLPTKGVFNRELVRSLAKDHDVRVVAPVSYLDELRARRPARRAMPPQRVETVDGVEVCYPAYYYTPKILRRHYGSFLWHSLHGTLRRLFAEFTPDVVLSYWTHPDGEVAVRAAREVGAAAVVITGGSDALLLSRNPSRHRKILDVLLRADAVIAVSRHLRDHVITEGVPPHTIHVWQRGVDHQRFCPQEREAARRRLGITGDVPLLLWVGRMEAVKGIDVLLDASARLVADGRDFRLCLAGDGPLRKPLEKKAQSGGLARRVRFLGRVRHEELPDWYRAADATVLPSRSEGLPNVLLESHACGTPFVASSVGGVPEIAIPDIDRLVEPDDAEALAAALAETLAAKRPDAMRTRAGVPSLAGAADSLLAILKPLVASKGKD